jgi:hypothetical protein
MASCSTKRRILSWMSLAFIGLAFAVFSWGTGYKLSLYYPSNSAAHRIPHAKLLSRNEQEPPRDKSLAGNANDTRHKREMGTLFAFLPIVHLVSAAALLRSSAHVSGGSDSHPLQYLRQRASLTFFFVLPPPVRA